MAITRPLSVLNNNTNIRNKILIILLIISWSNCFYESDVFCKIITDSKNYYDEKGLDI